MKWGYLGIFLFFNFFSHILFENYLISFSPDQSLSKKKQINLTNLYFHQGMLSDRIICYFDDEPICVYHPSKPYNKAVEKQIELFLPLASPAGTKIKNDMEEINRFSESAYSINFVEVVTPMRGIKIVINYNPKIIVCQYAPCYSITAQKGIIINLHHKNILEKVAAKTDKILHTVHNQTTERPKVMLDFGHGGFDCGKVTDGNVKEKDINFQVGSKVARLLRNKGYNVLLTRNDDIFVPLDQRTKMANEMAANLFVSIHANSALSQDISGVETYWSSRCFNRGTIIGSDPNIGTTVTSVMDQIDRSSKMLAEKIHLNVLGCINDFAIAKDRCVKQSLAQVLIGTDMPAALVEIGFLSNPAEKKRLQDPAYQLLLAQGISQGIEEYCQALST